MRFLLALLLIPAVRLSAQSTDSTSIAEKPFQGSNPKTIDYTVHPAPQFPTLPMRRIMIPVGLITYGVISQCDDELREFDLKVRNLVRKDADFHTPIDNYLQYSPGFAAFALKAAGVRSEHSFRDMTFTYLLANAMMGVTVQTIKKITKVPRPEGSGTNAFPSGHTATAFVGAEFLREEYKNVSPLIGLGGYAAAATTGILRIYNNKHWFRDVVAGAGFGILATQAAYYLEPLIMQKVFHKRVTGYHFNPADY